MSGSATISEVSLQLMSDLHLETPRFLPMYLNFELQPYAKYLGLLGDIGNIQDKRLFTFLEATLRQFELVFYVLGNHEPYGSDERFWTFESACERLGQFEERVDDMRRERPHEIGRFVFMDRRRLDINDRTTILGCTLFSHITPDQESTISLFVSDFSNISQWTTQSHNANHARDLAWLNSQVSSISTHEEDRQIIILTHHSPTTQSEANNPDHVEDPKGIQSAFATDLSGETCWMSPNVKAWAFGHTHWNCDFVDRGTGKRVVANQRGYGRDEIFDFDPSKVIMISE